MYNYHCQIAGLPELQLNASEKNRTLPLFIDEIKPALSETHLNWFNMLLYSTTHKAVVQYFATGEFDDALLPYFQPEWFEPDSGNNSLLPGYLRRANNRFHLMKEEADTLKMESVLYSEYYSYLRQSGNNFIVKWAIFEMGLKNFLTAKTCEIYQLSKQEQVVNGDSFASTLTRLLTLHKEVKAEWELAETIHSILENGNLANREMELDRLKWNYIDELNRFNYFTIETILGYLLKLIIIERWTVLAHTENDNLLAEISNKIVQDYLEKHPV